MKTALLVRTLVLLGTALTTAHALRSDIITFDIIPPKSKHEKLCTAVSSSDYEKAMSIVLDGVEYSDVNELCGGLETPLMIACKEKKGDLAELLVVQGKANVDIRAPATGETALMIASGHGSMGVVKLLLKRGRANTNIQKKSGATALMLASFGGYVDVVKALLTLGHANANLQENTGNTAITLASMKGYLNIIEVLVEEGRGDATIPSRDGWGALEFASHGGYPKIAEYVLEKHPFLAHMNGNSPLKSAILGGNRAICELLLSKHASHDEKDMFWNDDVTPFHFACREGVVDIVDMLLAKGYVHDVNYKDAKGSSALHHACQNGRDDVVRRLLSHPAVNVDITNDNDLTPLLIAVELGSLRQVVTLVEHGANANFHTKATKSSALHIACRKGHERIGRFLVNGGHISDIDARDKSQWSPIMTASFYGFKSIVLLLLEKGSVGASESMIYASMQGHADVVDSLLQRGASPNTQKESDGFSGLMYAAKKGYNDVVARLVAADKADVNLVEKDGWSALMFAIFAGHADIVQTLLGARDIDVNISCKSRGLTALMLACYQGEEAILKLLLDREDIDVGLSTVASAKTAEFYCRKSGMDEYVAAIQELQSGAREKKVGKWGKYKASPEQEL